MGSGEGRNRTGDTTVFSRVLYQLSYLAAAPKCSLTGRGGRTATEGRRSSAPRSTSARGGAASTWALRDPLRGLEDRLQELGIECEDWGNVETAVAEATASGSPQARFLDQIKETCERIAGAVARAVEEGRTPIVLGGDHSIALGTLGGLASVYGPGGVLWFDAHGDLNTPETSPSGNVHGMPLAAALGRDPERSPATPGRSRRSSPTGSSSSASAPSTRASARSCARAGSASTP